jgi:hypothetical protein
MERRDAFWCAKNTQRLASLLPFRHWLTTDSHIPQQPFHFLRHEIRTFTVG